MEAIGQLTGGVAHDFNNLLTVIVGNLETIWRHAPADDGKLRRAIDQVTRGAQRAVTLTQQLLAFSRRQPLNPKPTDINRLVAGMSDLIRRTIGENIAVETVLAGGLWRVEIDAHQLESALLNLAVNARDAMPDGGKLIETANAHLDDGYAERYPELQPGQYVVMCVTDTGTGMSADVIARVRAVLHDQADRPGHRPWPERSTASSSRAAGTSSCTARRAGHDGENLSAAHDYGGRRRAGDAVHPAADGLAATKSCSWSRTTTTCACSRPRTCASSVSVFSKRATRRRRTARAASGGAAALHRRRTARHEWRATGRRSARAATDVKVLFTTGYARNAIVHQGRLDAGVD